MNPDLRVGGSWRSIHRAEMFRGGSWRTLTRGEIYKGAAWHPLFTFVSPMTASASPSDVNGYQSSLIPTTVTSGYTTVTPSGGLGPYTYSWAGAGLSITNPTSATTAFYATVSPGGDLFTSATCTVTDSLGSTATANVGVDLQNTGY